MTDNEKIANLTGDAIRMSSEAVIKTIVETAVEAERIAGDLRIEADQLASEIRSKTDDLVGRINSFVVNCQHTSEKIREVRRDSTELLVDKIEKTMSGATAPVFPKISVVENK